MAELSRERIAELEEIARRIRVHIVRMIHAAGSGHPGGSLGAADIVTALYFEVMRIRPEEPRWPDRDRFILSKGHACPVLYAALAERGYCGKECLALLRKTGSPLQGHPDMVKMPGVDFTSGSLGQGLSVGVGMALAGRLDGKDYNVFVLLGDGEVQEGQVWEAAMAAAHYKLDRLVAIVDVNGLQVDGRVCEIMEVEPLAEKWRAFRWAVEEVDGHDIGAVVGALRRAVAHRGGPSCILARTVKGKGVSFMENVVDWHGSWIDAEQLARALAELGESPDGGGGDG